jgi:hypothetical protein
MNLTEFNNLTYQEKWCFVFKDKGVSFITFREYYNQKVTLYDCGNFFAEVYYFPAENRITKIEGFSQDDKKLNFYIDYMKKIKLTIEKD